MCGFVGGLQNSNHVSFMRSLFLNRINFSIMLSFNLVDMPSVRSLYTVLSFGCATALG